MIHITTSFPAASQDHPAGTAGMSETPNNGLTSLHKPGRVGGSQVGFQRPVV